MNTRRLKMVREAIAADPKKYAQDVWLHECGTPACIAGWAAFLSLQAGEVLLKASADCFVLDARGHRRSTVAETAGEWLELNWTQRREMFHGHPVVSFDANGNLHRRPASPAEALDMLDRAIIAGTVLWTPRA